MSDTAAASNKEFIRSLYGAFLRGDFATVIQGCTADTLWHMAPGYPAGGRDYRGPTELAEFFASVGATISFQKYDTHTYVAEGNEVVVFVDVTATGKQSGVTVSFPVVHRSRLEDGKIAEMWEVLDSHELMKAFS